MTVTGGRKIAPVAEGGDEAEPGEDSWARRARRGHRNHARPVKLPKEPDVRERRDGELRGDSEEGPRPRSSPRPLLVLHLSSRLAPPSRKQKAFSLAPTSCDPP